jgi:hypothetical protein
VAISAIAAAVLVITACGGPAAPRYPDQAPFQKGTIFFRPAGGFDPGDRVEVRGPQYGRCGRATYLGFWTRPGVLPLLATYAVEWPDGSREIVSSARVRPDRGAAPTPRCRS